MTLLGLSLDLLLIGLLGTMIFYAVRLHHRLEVLRSGKQDLEVLLRDLVTNTATAERNLRALQTAAEELSPTLQKQVAGARAAREELEFLLGSADAAADKLLAQISAAKGEIRPELAGPREAARPMPTPGTPILHTIPPVPVSGLVNQGRKQAASSPGEDNRRTAEADLLRAIEKLR